MGKIWKQSGDRKVILKQKKANVEMSNILQYVLVLLLSLNTVSNDHEIDIGNFAVLLNRLQK